MGLVPHIPALYPTGPPRDLVVSLLQTHIAHVDRVGKLPGCSQQAAGGKELVIRLSAVASTPAP